MMPQCALVPPFVLFGGSLKANKMSPGMQSFKRAASLISCPSPLRTILSEHPLGLLSICLRIAVTSELLTEVMPAFLSTLHKAAAQPSLPFARL